jgi:urea carboxylase
MDDKSFTRQRLLGNPPGTTALELTLTGPTLKFFSDTTIALTGAAMEAMLDDAPLPHEHASAVQAGQILSLGGITGPGQRSYLAVAGGFAAPEYLGSTATFTLGGFGGHTGGALRAGDTLRLAGLPQWRQPASPEPADADP